MSPSGADLQWTPGAVPDDEPVTDRFLRLITLTYDESDSDPGRRSDAAALHARHPELAASAIAVAAALADADAVAAHLAAAPDAALTRSGPYGWAPLLYQAYARPEPGVGLEASLRTARLLLAAGADPNDGRLWNGAAPPFTVLTGLFGAGERDQPPHAHALPLARIVLEAGADPNDGQTLYNRMFGTDDSHLELLFEFGLGRGDGGPWRLALGEELDSPEQMLRGLLHWAITHDERTRVELLAAHGVDLRAALDTTFGRATRGYRPVDMAAVNGHTELVSILERLGAGSPDLDAADRVIADALAGVATDATPADAALARERRPGLMVWAASLRRPRAVRRLVELGFGVNAYGRGDTTTEQAWETALHVAAGDGSVATARVLLDVGADPTLRDARFNATSLDWARHFDRTELIDLLEPLTPK